MAPTPHPLTLTVEQAAKILGIGRSTAYELVHTGAIPSLRLGRRIVVPTAKLAEQLGMSPHEVFSRCGSRRGEATRPGRSADLSEARLF
jgi:excisionase family DNA binding protein